MRTDSNGREIPPGRTRVIVRPGARSYQSLERSRGAMEPIDPGRHYIVEPGMPGDGPEYFPKPGQSTLKGLEDALCRAAWIAQAYREDPDYARQTVIRVSPDSARPRPIRWYQGSCELSVVPAPSQAGDIT